MAGETTYHYNVDGFLTEKTEGEEVSAYNIINDTNPAFYMPLGFAGGL